MIFIFQNKNILSKHFFTHKCQTDIFQYHDTSARQNKGMLDEIKMCSAVNSVGRDSGGMGTQNKIQFSGSS